MTRPPLSDKKSNHLIVQSGGGDMEVGANIQTEMQYLSRQIQSQEIKGNQGRGWGHRQSRGWGPLQGRGHHRPGNLPAETNSRSQFLSQCNQDRAVQAVSMTQAVELEQTESSLYFGIDLVYRERSVETTGETEDGVIQKTLDNLLVKVSAEFQIFIGEGDGNGEIEGESKGLDSSISDVLSGLREAFSASVLQSGEGTEMSEESITDLINNLDRAFDQLITGLKTALGISAPEEAGEVAAVEQELLETSGTEAVTDVLEETGTNDVLVSGVVSDETEATGGSGIEETSEAVTADDSGEAAESGVTAETGEEEENQSGVTFVANLKDIYAQSRAELLASLDQNQTAGQDDDSNGISLRLKSKMSYGYYYYQNSNTIRTAEYFRQSVSLQLFI